MNVHFIICTVVFIALDTGLMHMQSKGGSRMGVISTNLLASLVRCMHNLQKEI